MERNGQPGMAGRQRPWASGAGFALWLTLSVVATYVTMRYDFTPGRVGPRQSHWPAETSLVRSPDQTTVVAFLHPRCRCSRATVKQLIQTLETHQGEALIASVFVPVEPGDARAWEEGEYVRTIHAELPEANVFFDRGGREAIRFGALTSGTILVYDRDSQEVFRGGITDRRGGERENPGRQRLALALAGWQPPAEAATPVFGCPLVPPSEANPERTVP